MNERIQRGRGLLAERGYEMTPDEYSRKLHEARASVRRKMAEKGYAEFLTMSDDELDKIMNEATDDTR